MATLREWRKSKRDEFTLDIYDISVDGDYNPRGEILDSDPKIIALSDSIMEVGVLKPVIIKMVNGRPMLRDGHRRLAASKLAVKRGGVIARHIPATSVTKAISAIDEKYLPLIYNDNAEPLTMLEMAYQIGRLREAGHSVVDMAKQISKSRQHIYNLLMLNEVPDEIKDRIRAGELSASEVISSLKKKGEPNDENKEDEDSGHDCEQHSVGAGTISDTVKNSLAKVHKWINSIRLIVDELDRGDGLNLKAEEVELASTIYNDAETIVAKLMAIIDGGKR